MFETDVRYVYEFVGLSTLSEHARDGYSSHIICHSAWDVLKWLDFHGTLFLSKPKATSI